MLIMCLPPYKTCDSVKKARAWLADQGLNASFHDFKKQGVPEAQLDAWLSAVGWETLLNRKGTTWRKLDAVTQAGLSAANAAALLVKEAFKTQADCVAEVREAVDFLRYYADQAEAEPMLMQGRGVFVGASARF
jgi:arsenate reductase-like glutaredoxin family protein